MNTQSRIICQAHGYTADVAGFKCHNGPILSVTRKNHGGRYITGQDAIKWAEAIETSIDAGVQAALCRAIFNA